MFKLFFLSFWLIFTFFEYKVSIFNYHIFKSLSLHRYKVFYYIQHLIFVSFFTKLKIINQLPLNLSIGQFTLNSRRFTLLFNLRKILCSKKLRYLYITKGSGGSNIFIFPDFYSKVYFSLIRTSFLPYLEYFSNRFSLRFRLFRGIHDSFVYLKHNVLTKKNNFFSFGRFNILNSSFFIQYFPFYKIDLVDSFRSIFDSFLNFFVAGLLFSDYNSFVCFSGFLISIIY